MSTKILTLDEINSSKVFVSEIPTLSFQHPNDYLDQYLKILTPFGVNFTFEGEVGGKSKERENEEFEVQEEYTSYKRLIARGKLPVDYDLMIDTNDSFNHLTTEIGFVYSLDGKTPEMRAYRGKRVTVCSNGCIFGADSVTSINLAKSATKVVYSSLQGYADTAADDLGKYKEIIERLHGNKLSGAKLMKRIGEIIWACKANPKLGITCGNDMVTYLQDAKSKYALSGDSTNEWNLYNCCTESLKKSNILDEASKVLLLDKIFNPN